MGSAYRLRVGKGRRMKLEYSPSTPEKEGEVRQYHGPKGTSWALEIALLSPPPLGPLRRTHAGE